MANRRAIAAAFALVIVAAAGEVRAAQRLNNNLFSLNVQLGCRIVNSKVIEITNTTNGTIAAGTRITYDAIRRGNGLHYGETVNSPQLARGAGFQRGGSDSISCTAWYRQQPTILAPQ